MSSEYTFDDTAISDISDQSVIDITDDRSQKSNGGPIRNNKTSSSSEINEFFIRIKNSQKCQICATVYSSSTSTGTLKKHLEKKHPIEYQRKFTQTTLNFQRTYPYNRKENFKKRTCICFIIFLLCYFDTFFIYVFNNWSSPPDFLQHLQYEISDEVISYVPSISSLNDIF
ncbi:hypothetical protein RhiirB3_474802 [Rhizophagus irregularis]|nr:hypothetical protein RhiirB3_474802 [Rhizophagus irregularis]